MAISRWTRTRLRIVVIVALIAALQPIGRELGLRTASDAAQE